LDETFSSEDMTLAPGVVETIISLAVAQIEDVAVVGGSGISEGILSIFKSKRTVPGVIVTAEDGEITVEIRVQVYFGTRLPDLSAQIRSVVADAMKGQLGIDVAAVNVYIDGIVFTE
jgi:uncharacterized alkaline shock family protein YloU